MNDNPHKNKKDQSNNKINMPKNNMFVDPSFCFFNYLQLYPLDKCKTKTNNILWRPISFNKKNLDIHSNNLNMKINKMLDDIRRKKNETLINSISLIPEDRKIINILSDINKSYDSFFSANHNIHTNNIVKRNNYDKHDNPYTSFLERSTHRHILRPYKLRKPPPPIIIQKKIEYKYIDIDTEIKTIKDLLDLCDKYPLQEDVIYNINMKAIHNIKTPLQDLDNMIGMNSLKTSVVDQIIFFIQNLHKNNKHNDFMHTVLCGPPGTGKTEVAKIMGNIFSKMGVLSKNKFKKVTRADMIAGYLGQTAIKTKNVINDALGGVLFIDEAYSLGNREKRDSFAKEAIDTLCECLSNYKDDLMVIIAGYEDDLNKCFFNYNQGLDSRFTWRFNIDDYTPQELKQIFEKKIIDIEWSLKSKNEIPISWFEKNMSYFSFYGRDMETLLAKTKIAHGKRVFCKKKSEKKKIILEDLEKGFKMYLDNNEVQKRSKTGEFPYNLYS